MCLFLVVGRLFLGRGVLRWVLRLISLSKLVEVFMFVEVEIRASRRYVDEFVKKVDVV